jgi:hypothetical protein
MYSRRIFFSAICVVFVFGCGILALSNSAAQEEITDDDGMDRIYSSQFQTDEQNPEDAHAIGSSVNFREEFGFSSRQNIDSFLEDVTNPFESMPEENTYEGTRSEP